MLDQQIKELLSRSATGYTSPLCDAAVLPPPGADKVQEFEEKLVSSQAELKIEMRQEVAEAVQRFPRSDKVQELEAKLAELNKRIDIEVGACQDDIHAWSGRGRVLRPRRRQFLWNV